MPPAQDHRTRFRRQIGRQFTQLAEGAVAGGLPHHSFHVLGVYPWVGLLGEDRIAGKALQVLDRCRVRWGQVQSVTGDQVLVRSRPLLWDGRQPELGEPGVETARRSVGAAGSLTGSRPATGSPFASSGSPTTRCHTRTRPAC